MEQQAILVVSFGTSHDGTREKTIGALEREVASAYPSIPIRRAFTSKVILRGLERRGIQVDSVPQALDKLVEEFNGELQYITIAVVEKDKNGKPTIERVRTVEDDLNHHRK